jgi:hypothetical protein
MLGNFAHYVLRRDRIRAPGPLPKSAACLFSALSQTSPHLESMYGEWQPVIGLEIHAQINTRLKLFSGL